MKLIEEACKGTRKCRGGCGGSIPRGDTAYTYIKKGEFGPEKQSLCEACAKKLDFEAPADAVTPKA